MRPAIALDGAVLRANVRAFAALGAPVAAVVKHDGYGWGAARLAFELDREVESYVVADADEFWRLRPVTLHVIRILSEVSPSEAGAIVAHGGIPNVASREGLDALPRGARVRVGFIDAAGWSGIAFADAADFGAACAQRDLACELWMHVTAAERAEALDADFVRACTAFRASGARIAGIDAASTASATPARAHDRVRIGAGLFGAKLGADVATTCAIRVTAPVVRRHAPGDVAWAGYGERQVPAERPLTVYRFGYGDGAPSGLEGTDAILSLGMQYVTRASADPVAHWIAIGPHTDLDDLALRSGVRAHELIVALGRSA
jgi:alanine racemase